MLTKEEYLKFKTEARKIIDENILNIINDYPIKEKVRRSVGKIFWLIECDYMEKDN